MTRDDLKWPVVTAVSVLIAVITGLNEALQLGALSFLSDGWQHAILIAAIIAGSISGQLGNSPLPGRKDAQPLSPAAANRYR